MPPDTRYTSDSDLESVLSLHDAAKLKKRRFSGPKYKCNFCDDTFKRLDQLDRHEYKFHTGIMKHACTYEGCNKTYSILTHLKRHLRNTHERIKSQHNDVPCVISGCEKMFSSSCNMQRHVKQVHENPKIYYCSHCGEKFTQKLKMRRHEICKHTGIYPHNCTKCGKGFYQEWQYERHVNGCKVYTCSHCDEKFDKWTLYCKHCKEKKHDSKKYYKCEQCSSTFPKPGELQQHIALKHLAEGKHIEELLHKCSVEGCLRSYAYERNLKQHIKTAHTGQRFKCPEANCGRSFSSAQNLNKHVEKGTHGVDDNKIKKTKKKSLRKSKRKCRRDAGKPVLSTLSSLSGLAVDRQFDKLLRERNESALEVTTCALVEDADATLDVSGSNDGDKVETTTEIMTC